MLLLSLNDVQQKHSRDVTNYEHKLSLKSKTGMSIKCLFELMKFVIIFVLLCFFSIDNTLSIG